MHKLPSISGQDIIKALKKLDYEIVRQLGSHVRLYHRVDKSKKHLTVPLHKCIGKGLLHKVMRDAEISIEKLIELL